MERDSDLTDVDGCTIVDYKLNPFTLDKEKDFTGSSKITLITDNDKKIVIAAEFGYGCAIPWLSVKGNDLDQIKGHKFKNIVFDEKILDLQELNDELNDKSTNDCITSHEITISFYDEEDFIFYIHTLHNGYYDGWINVEVKDLN